MHLVNKHQKDLLMYGLQELVKTNLEKKKKLNIKPKRTDLTSDWNKFWAAAAPARKTCKEAYYNFVSKAFSGKFNKS